MEFDARVIAPNSALPNDKNRNWWESNPMIYDWDRNFGDPRRTTEYFEKIDRLFWESHSLCNQTEDGSGLPLQNFIPYSDLAGKKVLEIGCGAGLIASSIAKAGAELTAIDLTEFAVKTTQERFRLAGLKGDIRQMDAEKMEFADGTFDAVVSWGVIHHSGNMQAILDHIHRVLKPGGKAHLMIYNRRSLRYQVYCRVWLGIARKRYLKQSLPEIAGSITDGYIARHLNESEFRQMASRFQDIRFSYSDEPKTTSAYLLGPARRLFPATSPLGKKAERWLASRWGWYLQAALTK